MPQMGFEPTIPVFERVKEFHVLDHAVIVIYFKIFGGKINNRVRWYGHILRMKMKEGTQMEDQHQSWNNTLGKCNTERRKMRIFRQMDRLCCWLT
jgi:hypothetical protein